jgi:hypothetical protein
MDLSLEDYKIILKHYNLEIPSNKSNIKTKAENILAEKLCRCIKAVDPKDEKKSIAICNKSLFSNRNLKKFRFTCKKKSKLGFKKNSKKKLMKTKKRLRF